MDISESQVFFVVCQFWTNITILKSKSWVKTSNTKVWQIGNLLIEGYSLLQNLLHIWYLRMFTITNWLLLKKRHKIMRFSFCIYLVGLSWPIQSCLNVPLDSRPLTFNKYSHKWSTIFMPAPFLPTTDMNCNTLKNLKILECSIEMYLL